MTYDLILIGGTTLACAWAEKAQKDGKSCAILDSTGLVGYDYAQAWKPVAAENCPDEAAGLLEELKTRGAVNAEGAVHSPALAPVLCNRVRESGADGYFLSRVVKIARASVGFAVTAYSIGGEYTIYAKKIVDTTANFETYLFFGETKPELKERTLTVLIQEPQGETVVPAQKGCMGEGYYMALPMEAGESVATATHRIIGMAKANPEKFGNAKIVHIASIPMEVPAECGREFAKDAIWAPSVAYGNPFAAYAAGVTLSGEEDYTGAPAKLYPLPEIDDGCCDIAVAGLGTAGSTAAIYAAQNGLNVIGIENLNIPGGAGTAGSVMWYYVGERKNGYYDIIDRDFALCDDVIVTHPSRGGGIRKMVALEANFQRYGVNSIYSAMVTDVLTEGEKNVTGIRYLAEDGFHTLRAKQVIDATADGVICRQAGCEMQKGRATDGRFLPFSSCITVYDRESQIYKCNYRDCGVVDQYDAKALGEAILAANSDDLHLLENYNAGDSCHLDEKTSSGNVYMETAMLTGLRQGERIVGEESVNLVDVLNGKYLENPAFYMLSSVDTHSKDYAFEDRLLNDWLNIAGMWGWNLKVPVPAGVVIPKGWNGLLVAGRHASNDHNFSYGFRMMDDMCRLGEVAAVLAEYAIRTGKSVREMPYEELKEAMMKYGALKADDEPAIERQTAVPGKTENWRTGDNMWLTDPEEIKAGLSSDCYGHAMWSAKLLGAALRPQLNEWLVEANPQLQINAALTLSLNDFPEGEPALLDYLHDTTCYTSTTSKSYMTPRIMAVISACGRLHLRHSFLKINQFFQNPFSTDEMPIEHCKKFLYNREDLRFQFRSHAFMALLDVMEGWTDYHYVVADRMYKCLQDPEFQLSTTMMGSSSVRTDLVPTVRKIWAERFPNKPL